MPQVPQRLQLQLLPQAQRPGGNRHPHAPLQGRGLRLRARLAGAGVFARSRRIYLHSAAGPVCINLLSSSSHTPPPIAPASMWTLRPSSVRLLSLRRCCCRRRRPLGPRRATRPRRLARSRVLRRQRSAPPPRAQAALPCQGLLWRGGRGQLPQRPHPTSREFASDPLPNTHLPAAPPPLPSPLRLLLAPLLRPWRTQSWARAPPQCLQGVSWGPRSAARWVCLPQWPRTSRRPRWRAERRAAWRQTCWSCCSLWRSFHSRSSRPCLAPQQRHAFGCPYSNHMQKRTLR